ncbi:hypothetical protein A3709_15025 [Halioglobus sp. HI00S01]|uniref:DUF885 domain-containing protein n=1 Tax=Halioglobus sp. HI00S01 TaxID=1822214 RepID=UPI0007C2C71F|nr:DUF885 domain-containing protein [Halioglobus sp. HI00S01]KZX59594.1 hypothetical protein A3709_15025 [Halioglobus sp. HI00S01]
MRALIAAVAVSLVGQTAVLAASPKPPPLNNWLDQAYEQELQASPMTLTAYGSKEKYDQVDDWSVAAQEQETATLVDSAARMAQLYDYDALTPQEQVSFDFWTFRADSDAAQLPFLHHGYVFDQFRALHTYPVRFLLNYHRVDSDADMVAYIERVKGLAGALGQGLVRAQKAASMGIRPPRFAYETVITESRGVISGKPFAAEGEDSVVWADGLAKIAALHDAGTIDARRMEALTEALAQALREDFQPAYEALIAWHEGDIENTSASPKGVHSLPSGDAYYAERLAFYTHSDMSAEEVHQLGLTEVARIQAEMATIMREVGFKGSLQDFFAYVRDDERFYYPDTDAGRAAYIADVKRLLLELEPKLPEYFGILPTSPLEVRRVEPYREQDGAAQFYQVGTADGSRPGIYYIHLSDMTAYNKTDLETTAYHEGSPGHHMQLSIAKELTGIPQFRNNVGYSAYWEGWALYSEYLALEMGAFQDPYNNFGRLVAEIWRAIRLVVDTGLHAKAWSEEQAVGYMLNNSAIPESAVRSEIQRYLVAPGQAASYKAGMLKIQALRADAERRLGDQFDIREFHDTVLGGGAVPLPVLEKMVSIWVEGKREEQ